MARKLRLEFPGACYHVINRGNYQADLFKTEKTKAAFEACWKSDWVLQAFVIMRTDRCGRTVSRRAEVVI